MLKVILLVVILAGSLVITINLDEKPKYKGRCTIVSYRESQGPYEYTYKYKLQCKKAEVKPRDRRRKKVYTERAAKTSTSSSFRSN